MRHFITLLVAVTAAALCVAACSSGSGSSGAGGGAGPIIGSAGAAGDTGNGTAGRTSTGDAKCVGSYSTYVASGLLAASVADKACANASDSATVCVNDMASVAGDCGKACLGMGDDAAQATCVAHCINDEGNLAEGSGPIGTDCTACYTADVECARKQCLTRCGLAPTSTDCADCRYEKGCAAAFYACSGFPDPRAATSGAGGAGGEIQASAGAGGI